MFFPRLNEWQLHIFHRHTRTSAPVCDCIRAIFYVLHFFRSQFEAWFVSFRVLLSSPLLPTPLFCRFLWHSCWLLIHFFLLLFNRLWNRGKSIFLTFCFGLASIFCFTPFSFVWFLLLYVVLVSIRYIVYQSAPTKLLLLFSSCPFYVSKSSNSKCILLFTWHKARPKEKL